MRRGLNLCLISSCFSSCILNQNAVFWVKKAALETLSRFKKARKNGHIPGISQYMAVSAMVAGVGFEPSARGFGVDVEKALAGI